MRIGLKEQLQASFPSDPIALKNMLIEDVGVDDLGINASKLNGEYFLDYPIHIFSARN